MRIALLAAWNERYKPVAHVTAPAMLMYAQQHGYGFHIGIYREDPNELGTYGDRGKIDLYLKYYDDHDILVWLDIDTLIANPDIPVEEVLGSRQFLWTYDHNGPCSGFWIARCQPEVAVMFNKVRDEAQLSRSSIARVVDNPKRVVVEFEPYGSSDQMTMRALMGIPPFDAVLGRPNVVSCKEAGHCFDYPAMKVPEIYNFIANYEPGDWLYTVPSLPLETRIELLREKARLIYGSDYPGLGDSGDPAAGEPAGAVG